MTDAEKKRSSIKKRVNKFMENAEEFIKSKNNGTVPLEWIGLLDMLRDYYTQYCNASWEISQMDTYLTMSRYGETVSPIFKLQATAAANVQRLCGEFGLSMKQAQKMKVKTPEKEKSVLDSFFEDNMIEKR